jgi:hypothetical protein
MGPTCGISGSFGKNWTWRVEVAKELCIGSITLARVQPNEELAYPLTRMCS